MNFSLEWDSVYRSGSHRSTWPWSDLVSLVHRHAAPSNGFKRVLELGCGAGANIPFFVAIGCDYSGIEGSTFAVDDIRKRFHQIADRIVVGDFTAAIPFVGAFDLVVDRGSITHNTTRAVEYTLQMLHERLRPGGKFIGVDWFSDQHTDFSGGSLVDGNTKDSFTHGQFVGVGRVHFSDRDHLTALLGKAGFLIEAMEHKIVDYVTPSPKRFAAWNFVAVKPVTASP
jgi:SAM-dependent methyltransferase